MGSKKTIYHNINFIKLILVLVIVYYHIIAGKLSVLYPNVIQFTKMSNKILNTGSYAVVIFFIISGFNVINTYVYGVFVFITCTAGN